MLMIAVIVPVYALGDQSGNMQQKRDQDCEPESPSTRAYGEDPPVQAQEEKPEELSEGETLQENGAPIQEQNQTQEQLRSHDCENEECEQFQYQFQYQFQEQYRNGQEED